MSAESREARLKRLHMRAWRRGIKEMDLVLGRYADARLASLDEARLTLFDALLNENDQDLLAWITGQGRAPEHLAPLLAEIAAEAPARATGKTTDGTAGQAAGRAAGQTAGQA